MAVRPPRSGTPKPGMQLPMRVWDLPIRLFHWLLVVAVVAAYVTRRIDRMDLHILCGYAVMALVLFRLVWGFIGSDTARFTFFLKSPLAALRHLAHFARREPDREIGHNAAGGWMVLLLLLVLAIQVGTGLFASDGPFARGPLASHVSDALSDRLSGLHELNFTVLQILVGLHVLAVIAYAVVKRHDLVRPMLTGKKRLPAATRAPRMAPPALAIAVFALACVVVWVVVTRV